LQASKGTALKSNDYLIEFNKLRMGSNTLEFILDGAFFQAVEGGVISEANVKVELELVRTETMHDLHFTLAGMVSTICDNCLDPVSLPVEGDFHLMMKISETEDYSDDEIIYITKGLLEYDLSQYLYESVVLSIPPRKVCTMAGKTCNPEIASKINDFQGSQDGPGEDNPLWDKLKGIFNNN
jgi:uncharacterized metal-binding protein YceD (DUF177 family)